MNLRDYKFKEVCIYLNNHCNLKCKYCQPAGSLILMSDLTWKPIEEIQEGDQIIGVKKEWSWQYIIGSVEKIGSREAEVFEVQTKSGSLYVTGEHPILGKHNRWRIINKKNGDGFHLLKKGHLIRKILDPIVLRPETFDYEKGYLSGAIKGDGLLKKYHYKNKDIFRFRFVVKDQDFQHKVKWLLEVYGITLSSYFFKNMNKNCIYTNSEKNYYRIKELISIKDSSEWLRGFLAGMFDAEGSYQNNILRISNKDEEIINLILRGLTLFNINHTLENYNNSTPSIRIHPTKAIIKFFSLCNPVILRKKYDLIGRESRGSEEVISIKKIGKMKVYNLQTSCETFISDGYIVHNCFLDNKYKAEISTETLINTLEFIKHYADPKGFHLHFFGTEPLLSWGKLYTALKWIDGHAPHWGRGITSNMTLMTYYKANILVKHNVQVLASFDGIKEIHNKYRVFRNNRGTWNRVMYGIQVFAGQGGNYGIAMTMLPENLDKMLESVRLAYSIYPKPRFIALNKVVDHWITPYDSRKLYKNLKKIAEWWMKTDPNYPLQFLHKGCKSFETKHVYRSRWTCGALWGSFGIDWKGNIYPCHRMIESAWKIGTVFDDIDYRWIDFYRSLDFAQCHLCPNFSCGCCYIHNFYNTKSIYKLPQESCKVESIRNQLIREIYPQWKQTINEKTNSNRNSMGSRIP